MTSEGGKLNLLQATGLLSLSTSDTTGEWMCLSDYLVTRQLSLMSALALMLMLNLNVDLSSP